MNVIEFRLSILSKKPLVRKCDEHGRWFMVGVSVVALGLISACSDSTSEVPNNDMPLQIQQQRKSVLNDVSKDDVSLMKDEGEVVDVDVPIKSLCGFVFGSTRHESWKLFRENQNLPYTRPGYGHDGFLEGSLLKPFRVFTEASLQYVTRYDNAPKRLFMVTLSSRTINYDEMSRKSCEEELENVRNMLEKKFGITMKGGRDSGEIKYRWEREGVEYLSLQLDRKFTIRISCEAVVDEICKKEQEAKKKDVGFGEDEGADQL